MKRRSFFAALLAFFLPKASSHALTQELWIVPDIPDWSAFKPRIWHGQISDDWKTKTADQYRRWEEC